jgi:hypothetical protein
MKVSSFSLWFHDRQRDIHRTPGWGSGRIQQRWTAIVDEFGQSVFTLLFPRKPSMTIQLCTNADIKRPDRISAGGSVRYQLNTFKKDGNAGN